MGERERKREREREKEREREREREGVSGRQAIIELSAKTVDRCEFIRLGTFWRILAWKKNRFKKT